jgi:hypothetical protein
MQGRCVRPDTRARQTQLFCWMLSRARAHTLAPCPPSLFVAHPLGRVWYPLSLPDSFPLAPTRARAQHGVRGSMYSAQHLPRAPSSVPVRLDLPRTHARRRTSIRAPLPSIRARVLASLPSRARRLVGLGWVGERHQHMSPLSFRCGLRPASASTPSHTPVRTPLASRRARSKSGRAREGRLVGPDWDWVGDGGRHRSAGG